MARHIVITAFVSIVISSSAAASPPRNDVGQADIQTYIQTAQAHADTGEYRRALAIIDQGLAAYPRQLRLLQLRASILLELRELADALAAFKALLDAGITGPNRRQVHNIIRHLHGLGNTSLAVAINVPADVYVEDKSLGLLCERSQRCTQRLLPGRYPILIQRQGFVPVRKWVRLRPEKKTQISVELRELPSPITVQVYPADAEILLNEQPWDARAADGDIPAGKYVLEVRRPGYVTEKTRVVARLGQPVVLDIALSRRILLHISPPDATLTLDGRPIALEPLPSERADEPPNGPGNAPGNALGGGSPSPALVMAEGVLRIPHRPYGPGAAARATQPRSYTLVVRRPNYADARVELPAKPSASLPPDQPITIVLAPLEPKQQQPPLSPSPSQPPPSSPSSGSPTTGPWYQRALLSATGTATLASAGVSMYYYLNARTLDDRAEGDCETNEYGAACGPAGLANLRRAHTAAKRAHVAAAVSAAAAVGSLWVATLGSPLAADGRMQMRRKISIAVAGGIAVAGLSIGANYGWRAHRQRRNADDVACNGNAECERNRIGLRRRARSDTRTAALGASTAGVAAVAAGLMWWFAPTHEGNANADTDIRIRTEIGRDRVGASVSFPLP